MVFQKEGLIYLETRMEMIAAYDFPLHPTSVCYKLLVTWCRSLYWEPLVEGNGYRETIHYPGCQCTDSVKVYSRLMGVVMDDRSSEEYNYNSEVYSTVYDEYLRRNGYVLSPECFVVTEWRT